MNYNDQQNRDEFYWESQLRKDDIRINACMKEISAVIDLPGEDELLMTRIKKQPEYVQKSQSREDDVFEDFFEMEEALFSDNWRDAEGAKVYSKLEESMKEWCRVFAKDSSSNHLQVLCHYGSLMGFAVDLVDFGEDKITGLKIAFCKRIYGGLNNILAILDNKSITDQLILNHKKKLLDIRQEVLDLRFKLQRI